MWLFEQGSLASPTPVISFEGWISVGSTRPVTMEELNAIPEVVVLRLPLYIRVLKQLLKEQVGTISSEKLGERLSISAAQIRKDLSYFGRFGKQGQGYNVEGLLGELNHILGLDRTWNVCLVGVGRLGRAIIGYPGFAPEGFNIVAAFDASVEVVGQRLGSLRVQPMEDLKETIRSQEIRIAIAAVPANQSQPVIDRLVGCGIRAILNYAPTTPTVPPNVWIRSIDPVTFLQSMTYYLNEG
jgi:redox-sensing transcriptional repressor